MSENPRHPKSLSVSRYPEEPDAAKCGCGLFGLVSRWVASGNREMGR
jgi:hypothetical protein